MNKSNKNTKNSLSPDVHAALLGDTWAALDLGSNSFHLLLAKTAGASFFVTERLKEKVQLLSGFHDGQIPMAAQLRGLDCLARFSQRLAPVSPDHILAFGTYALRQAENAGNFLQAAQELLGVPVHVISGEYEAQLIYAAVAHHAGEQPARCVVDIGGGSTEFALGTHKTPREMVSVGVGCVAYKERFFNGEVSQSQAFINAKAAALQALGTHLQPWRDDLLNLQGVQAYGTSGTVQSIQTVLNANGWSGGVLTASAMQMLEQAIVEEHWVIDAGVPGLPPDRADIFPAGAAILCACFDFLGLQQMEYADVTLLQGMIGTQALTNPALVKPWLHPLTADADKDSSMTENSQAASGASDNEEPVSLDLREDSVRQLQQRFAVDMAQAARVKRCAQRLFADSQDWWQGDDECGQLLSWAADLHELGTHISARHYHRHGAYVVKHAEMPGFSDHQQSVLALLIRGHRRSMPGLAFRTFDPSLEHKLLRLVALLRIAVILERSHADEHSPNVSLHIDGDLLTLDCGDGWLAAHPLSWRELQVEQQQQASAGLTLSLTL